MKTKKATPKPCPRCHEPGYVVCSAGLCFVKPQRGAKCKAYPHGGLPATCAGLLCETEKEAVGAWNEGRLRRGVWGPALAPAAEPETP